MIISKINITIKTQLKWYIFTTTEQTLNQVDILQQIFYHSNKNNIKDGYSNCYRRFSTSDCFDITIK